VGSCLVRFIHTADWQLGMKREYLGEEAQARYCQDSFNAIRDLGDLAKQERAQFIVVSGDVFESNFVERKTVHRALEAMAHVQVPIILLPGNHDPMDPSSIYKNKTFLECKPSNVTIVKDSTAIDVSPGVQIIGAPWKSKRILSDILSEACLALEPLPGVTRIMLGHGVVSSLSMNREDPAIINLLTLENAINDGLIHYVALGDRHSVTSVGNTKRIWYSGSHLATDFGEDRSGSVLVVDLDGDCSVQVKPLSFWQFVKKDFLINSDADISTIESYLSSLANKDKTVVRLGLRGTVSAEGRAKLDEMLDNFGDLYASIEEWEKDCDLVVSFGEEGIAALGLHGFAEETMKRLVEESKATGTAGKVASDAVALLHRLARGCTE